MNAALGSLLINAMLNYLLALMDTGDFSDFLVLLLYLIM